MKTELSFSFEGVHRTVPGMSICIEQGSGWEYEIHQDLKTTELSWGRRTTTNQDPQDFTDYTERLPQNVTLIL